jgi:serine/threonine protein kinase
LQEIVTYRLDEELPSFSLVGRGGMGTVYEAWKRSLQRVVAVKVLSEHTTASSRSIQRFQCNARDTEEVVAPRRATVSVKLAGDVAKKHPLTPDGSYSCGATASPEHLAAGDASAEHLTTVARHLAKVADAVEYAHTQGVVHREIKPHNLILRRDGSMRISDLGLARVSKQPGVTVTGEVTGSPVYMAREQIAEAPSKVDSRTDIYSLGATMYEWLTLRPPHAMETRERVITNVLGTKPKRLKTLSCEIPMDLETVCLDRQPSKEKRVELLGLPRLELENEDRSRTVGGYIVADWESTFD